MRTQSSLPASFRSEQASSTCAQARPNLDLSPPVFCWVLVKEPASFTRSPIIGVTSSLPDSSITSGSSESFSTTM